MVFYKIALRWVIRKFGVCHKIVYLIKNYDISSMTALTRSKLINAAIHKHE